MTSKVLVDEIDTYSATTLTIDKATTIPSLALTTALPLTSGGTGGATAALARTSLDVDQAGTATAMAIALG